MEAPVAGLPSSAVMSRITGTPFSDLFSGVGSPGDKATGFLEEEPALSTLPWPGDSTLSFERVCRQAGVQLAEVTPILTPTANLCNHFTTSWGVAGLAAAWSYSASHQAGVSRKAVWQSR
ncbi:unnamed protein product [Rangifer tarandus platyrhynchus]|uniref:Uncharacterized protein n=2 Tax=Rangifer tarandus platyrhynchus TaxID=3082113 RepID=A0ABN8YTV9_RANTA|nr:unnamed protein product [Rangifer tarandus platyrhynchus]